jgi:phosphoglycolate phosphatase-like HAD superfamily hydrolase
MKLIIFDFDGTLVDSRKLIWESRRIIFGEFGFPCPSQKQSLALIGMSLEPVLAHRRTRCADRQDGRCLTSTCCRYCARTLLSPRCRSMAQRI